jgi:hypothetical protein
MTRGRCGSLLLHRSGLSPPTSCRCNRRTLISAPAPRSGSRCGRVVRERPCARLTSPRRSAIFCFPFGCGHRPATDDHQRAGIILGITQRVCSAGLLVCLARHLEHDAKVRTTLLGWPPQRFDAGLVHVDTLTTPALLPLRRKLAAVAEAISLVAVSLYSRAEDGVCGNLTKCAHARSRDCRSRTGPGPFPLHRDLGFFRTRAIDRHTGGPGGTAGMGPGLMSPQETWAFFCGAA